MDNQVNPSLSRGTKVRRIAGTAGFFAVAIGAAGYIFLAGTQRELNPVRAYQAERQQVQAADDKQKRYGALVNQLFGEQGLADTNGDRAYSFEELVNAYRRMGPRFQDRVYYVSEFGADYGYNNKNNWLPVPSTRTPSQPTLSELEMAVQSFQAENVQSKQFVEPSVSR